MPSKSYGQSVELNHTKFVSAKKPREIAFYILLNHLKQPEFVEIQLQKGLGTLSYRDKALCRELVSGVLRWESLLNWMIQRFSNKSPSHDAARVLLCLGLYQLFWLHRIPDHAIVYETVELAQTKGMKGFSGYVNAILRRCIREKAVIQAKIKELQDQKPALGFSHPDWLFKRWVEAFGKSATLKLMEWNNTAAPLFARLNTLKIDTEKLKECWNQEGWTYEIFERDWYPSGWVYRIEPSKAPQDWPGFHEGYFYIQDPSTLMAVDMLDPQPGEKILDFCAAPGGKTTYISQLMQNTGVIHARDWDSLRLIKLEENCRRCGVLNVESARSHDAFDPDFNTLVDRILVDAPCSNTGVLRRRLEARWRLNSEGLTALIETQKRLLDQAAPQVKPGGTLVYSTCSIDDAENSQLIRSWLEGHPHFRLERERLLTPFTDGVDGAYAAKLIRIH